MDQRQNRRENQQWRFWYKESGRWEYHNRVDSFVRNLNFVAKALCLSLWTATENFRHSRRLRFVTFWLAKAAPTIDSRRRSILSTRVFDTDFSVGVWRCAQTRVVVITSLAQTRSKSVNKLIIRILISRNSVIPVTGRTEDQVNADSSLGSLLLFSRGDRWGCLRAQIELFVCGSYMIDETMLAS